MTRLRLSSLSLSAIAVLAVGGALRGSPKCASAGELVSIQAENGRVFAGEVDAGTDGDLLWLRSTAPSIVIKVGIRWSTVVKARYADREFSAAEFRPLAEKLKSELPRDFFSSKPVDRSAAPGGELDRTETRLPQKIRSIRIEADAANWDPDVELDGLELRVFPVAGDGSVVPVEGMLRVRLIGQNFDGRGEAFQEIGRWNEKVRLTDYDGPRGALYRLPFRTINPEFDLEFGSYGIVDAQLGVPGHGSFEASREVRVRTYSSLRDQLQLREHRRFFPSERTGWRGR